MLHNLVCEFIQIAWIWLQVNSISINKDSFTLIGGEMNYKLKT